MTAGSTQVYETCSRSKLRARGPLEYGPGWARAPVASLDGAHRGASGSSCDRSAAEPQNSPAGSEQRHPCRLPCADRDRSLLLDGFASRSRHLGVGSCGLQKRQALCGFSQDLRGALPQLDRLGVGTSIVAALPRGTRQSLVRNHSVVPGRQPTTELHGTGRPYAMGDGLIVAQLASPHVQRCERGVTSRARPGGDRNLYVLDERAPQRFPLGAGRSSGALRPASDSSRPHHQVVALPAAASESATRGRWYQTMGDALINDSSLHGCGWHSSREGARQRYPGRAPALSARAHPPGLTRSNMRATLRTRLISRIWLRICHAPRDGRQEKPTAKASD